MPLAASPRLLLRSAFVLCALALPLLAVLQPVALPGVPWDKANHVIAFLALAVAGSLAWPGRPLALLAGLVAYGAGIEAVQALTGHREADWGDLAADAVGAAAAVLAVLVLRRLWRARR